MKNGWLNVMSKVKVVLNSAGVRELLKSTEITSIIERHAEAIARKGAGEVETYIAPTRVVAKVSGDDGNNGLLKAVGNHD